MAQLGLVRDPAAELFEELLQAGRGDLEVVKPGGRGGLPDLSAGSDHEQMAPAVAGEDQRDRFAVDRSGAVLTEVLRRVAGEWMKYPLSTSGSEASPITQ
jgi:hypothetical protein